MTRFEKLIEKLKNPDFIMTWKEIEKLLKGFGYELITKGKTSGSRVSFYRKFDESIISFHKPHPGNEIKRYVKKHIIKILKKKGDV